MADDIMQKAIKLRKMYNLIVRENPRCLVCDEPVEDLAVEDGFLVAKPCNHQQYESDQIPYEWRLGD